MFLQALWSLFLAYPGRTLNSLALFFALAGAALLLMTRFREQRALARMAGCDAEEQADGAAMIELPTQRLNPFFYSFASAALVLGLLLSELSTRF
ncbi:MULTISPECIES: hypothetical protein [Pseudomonas]|uniref:Uncharacterized protein n=1 Tax=Pseudomonas segetis TaxID=298908 RepID=A0A239CR54_9PSED|nr:MULTISPECIES: hypothetical protein [Pseudomonas]SNS22409.1 hypothetical protein SAMN05216255_1845 [Pseudomonas segetis]